MYTPGASSSSFSFGSQKRRERPDTLHINVSHAGGPLSKNSRSVLSHFSSFFLPFYSSSFFCCSENIRKQANGTV
jgi:hypothetical protein